MTRTRIIALLCSLFLLCALSVGCTSDTATQTTTTTTTTTTAAITTTAASNSDVTTTVTDSVTTTTEVTTTQTDATTITTTTTTAAPTTTTTTQATTTRRTQRTQSTGNSGGSSSDDFRGKTVKIMSHDNFTGDSAIQMAYALGIKNWSTRYGSTVEFVTAGYGYADLQAAISAGDSPDLFYQVERFPEICAVGLVQPIDDYLPADQKVLNEQALKAGSWCSMLWGMSVGGGSGRSYISFDKELFAANPDITTPREYFEKDNWTWDTFRTVAKDVLKATGYGVKFNQIPTFGGHDIVSVADNGRVTSTLTTDEHNRDLLQWIYRLKFTDKVFNDETYAISVYQTGAEPKYGANGETSIVLNDRYWEIVPFPANPKTGEWVSHEQIFSFVVPVGAQNPAMSVDLALSILAPWKAEVDGYTYNAYEQKVRDTAKNATPILKYPDVYTYLPYNDGDTTYGVLYNTATATAIEQLKDVHASACNTYNSAYIGKN